MLHVAEPFLERNLHPTVIIRGYNKALEDALSIVDELAFPIDTTDREQMLKIIASCIGTKFTSRFGTLMPVKLLMHSPTSPLLSFSVLLLPTAMPCGKRFDMPRQGMRKVLHIHCGAFVRMYEVRHLWPPCHCVQICSITLAFMCRS